MSAIFGRDRTALGVPHFTYLLCTDQPGLVHSDIGVTYHIAHGLDRIPTADLVCVPSWLGHHRSAAPEAIAVIRKAYHNGAIVASMCSGAFVLAETGLLDGRRATTHWALAESLARQYPKVLVEPRSLYIDEGQIITGAGAYAGNDMCLYLLRREFGAAAAKAVAQDLVVPPHRSGGQAQFIPGPLPERHRDDRLAEVTDWASANLHLPLTLDQLATRARMSRSAFAQHFKDIHHTTPHVWLLNQRLHLAEELLETTDHPVENIAHLAGFRTAKALRVQFARWRGVPPSAYRSHFHSAAIPRVDTSSPATALDAVSR